MSDDAAATKQTRSREGCFECRRKKRKCDQVRPQCGICSRNSSACIYPPQEWDAAAGRYVTARIPNKRRSRANTSQASEVAVDVPPSQNHYMPIQQSAQVDLTDTDIPFDFFSDFFDLDAAADPAPAAYVQPQTSVSAAGSGAASSSVVHAIDPALLLIADQVAPLTNGGVPAYHGSADTLAGLMPTSGSRTLSQAPGLGVAGQEKASMHEIRAFWGDLLQFYASLTDHYYYSTSPAARQTIFGAIINPSLTDVHLAASAFLCAASLTWLLTGLGDQKKAAEWKLRTASFYEAATELLRDSSVPLFSRMGTVTDLRLGHILQDDTEGAQRLLRMGRDLMRAECGAIPVWILSNRLDSETIAFQTFVFTDILNTVVLKGQRPIFPLQLATPLSAETGLLVHLGVPAFVLVQLSRITIALLDKTDSRAEIESALKGWQPQLRPGLSSGLLIETLATQIMWREAALMWLYQSLFKERSVAIRRSLSEFLRAAALLKDVNTNDGEPRLLVCASRACAWFLAGTNAVTPSEREQCTAGLKSCGNERVYVDNLKAVQVIWAAMDESGAEVDWKSLLAAKGLTVAFL